MESNKESFSWRYSTSGILITILVCTLIAILCANLVNIEAIDQNIGRFEANIGTGVMSPYTGRSDVNTVKYILRIQTVPNYYSTKEYKDMYPNSYVVYGRSGEIVYRGDVEGFDRTYVPYYNDNPLVPIKDNTVVEEPRYEVITRTNILTGKNEDPQEFNVEKYLSSNSKEELNYELVKGYIENDQLEITKLEKATKAGLSNSLGDNLLYNNVNGKLYEFRNYHGIESAKNYNEYIDYGKMGVINRVNFMYLLDYNDPEILEIKKDGYLLKAVLFGALAMIIILVYGIISNYRLAADVGFVKGIKAFPIEVVLLLCFLWVVGPLVIGSNFHEIEGILRNTIIGGILIGILIFTGMIAIYYFVMAFKSFHYEGGRSFVFRNSILCRIVNRVGESAGKIYRDSSENSVMGNYTKQMVVIFLAFGLLGVLGSVLMVRNGFRLVVFIIYMAILLFVLSKLNGTRKNLVNVNEKSSKIAGGDFSVKLSEEGIFGEIGRNFNSIGDGLDIAVENAIKSERLKTELITNVSHDLKTPLTSIINYSDLIVDEKTNDSERIEYAKIINEKGIKLKKLIEDLFEVSKITSKNIDLDLESLDIKNLLIQVIGEWKDNLESKGLKLVTTLPSEPVILILDGQKISRVLDNVFSNVSKYAMENSRVYISMENTEGYVTIEVKNISDYELNIDPEELMERFVRGDSSRTNEGSGLGLSIASSLIEAHGGEFNIKIDGDLFKIIIRI